MLIGVELVSEFVHTGIATGRVAGSAPVSELLIAHPEAGKTSIVAETNHSSSVCILTDISSQGVYNACRMPELTHLILNDLTSITAHKASVSKLTVAALNAMTEEGIKRVAVGPLVEDFSARGRKGIIACLTLDLAKDGRSWWNRIGFTTRMLPFCYSHSRGLQVKIKTHIIDQITGKTVKAARDKKVYYPKARRVSIAPKFAKQVEAIAEAKSRQLTNENTSELGYRRLKQFLALVQGHALLQRRNAVNSSDLEFLSAIQPYISYTNPWPI